MSENVVEADRKAHLAWCKARALQYVDDGLLSYAWGSMVSDLRNHETTRDHIGIDLGSQLFFAGLLDTPQKMRAYIEGFN